jgi:hypothetical protein
VSNQNRKSKETLLKLPLFSSSYLLSDSASAGTINDFRFIIAEVDLTADSMLIHMNADVQVPGAITARIELALPDGSIIPFKEKRYKNGALMIKGDWLGFLLGKHGSFVLDFPKIFGISAFTVGVNDQPLM